MPPLVGMLGIPAPDVRAVGQAGAAGVFELLTLVGYYATLALQLRVFRVPAPDGTAPDGTAPA